MGSNIELNNTRLARNTIVLYMRTILVMFIAFFTTRELLSVLGSENYGIYNVVGSIVVLFSFVSTSLTQATQRYITYELGNENKNEAHKIYNVSLYCQLIIIVIFVTICELFAPYFLENYLNIQENRMEAALCAFQISLFTFCVNILRTPCEAAVIAHEDMPFFAIVSILDAVLKLLIIYLIGTTSFDKLVEYTVLLLVVSVITCIIYYVYCLKNYVICRFSLVKDIKIFKQLFSFSGWSMCGGITNVLTQNGFVFMLNIFYGVIANASMGIANQVNNAIGQFIASFQTSFRPQIVKSCASGEIDYMNTLIKSTSKYSFFLAFVPISILVANMPFILSIWIGGNIPEFAVGFCSVILVCSLIDATTGPYYCAIMATGRIALYQILISISFLLDLIISYILMKQGLSPIIVLSFRILTRGIINMIIGLGIMKKQICFDIRDYLRSVVGPIVSFLIIIIPCIFFLMQKFEGGLLLIISTVSILLLGCFLFYALVLTSKEKQFVNFKVLKIISKCPKNTH